jgi:hypothetical protein
MPVVLLPFSQYAIILIIAILVTGAGVAGIVTRSLRRRMPRAGAAGVFIGLVALQVIAVVQTTIVVRAGLQDRAESDLYLAALVGVCVLSILTGTLTFFLIAASPPAGGLVGLGIVALAFGPWLSGLLVPSGSIPADAMITIVGYVRWVPAVLVGAAIAWAGVGTIGRILAALFDLALVWFVPALTTGIFYASGSRVLAHDPVEMVDAGVDVFFMALTTPELALPPVGVAVSVAAIGLVARRLLENRPRRREPTHARPA